MSRTAFSVDVAIRRRLPMLVALASVVALLAVACGPSRSTPIEVSSGLSDVPAGEISFVESDVKLAVRGLATNPAREMAPQLADFGTTEAPAGLLHIYAAQPAAPGTTRTIFRQAASDVATDVAFIDTDGVILAIESLAAASRSLDTAKQAATVGASLMPNPQMSQTPESVLADETDRITTAVYPGVNVRYALQVPKGWFAAHKIAVGATMRVPDSFTKLEADPAVPLLEFEFMGDGGSRGTPSFRKAAFNVRFATTPETRDYYLSTEGLQSIGPKDAVFVLWPEPRTLRFHVRDLPVGLYLSPINVPSGANTTLTGKLLPMVPPSDPNLVTGKTKFTKDDMISFGESWWDDRGVEFARPFDYVSGQPYNGFVLFSAAGINTLGLAKAESVFGGFSNSWSTSTFITKSTANPELLGQLRREAILPDPPVSEAKLATAEGEAVTARVRVLLTDADRARGLALVNELKAVPPGIEGNRGSANGGFDPTIATAKGTAEGYLLMFDGHRQRPLVAGGLKAPFDLAVFDEADKLAAVQTVTDVATLDPGTLSAARFKYLMVMPAGWFAAKKLVAGQTQPLGLPASITRQVAEADKYEIFVDGRPVLVEVALTENEAKRGWMWRRTQPADSGFLMLAPETPEVRPWGMCLFHDVAVAFIHDGWGIEKLATIEHAQLPQNFDVSATPDDERPNTRTELEKAAEKIRPQSEIRFRLLMPAKWFAQNAVTEGATIELGPTVKAYLATVAPAR